MNALRIILVNSVKQNLILVPVNVSTMEHVNPHTMTVMENTKLLAIAQNILLEKTVLRILMNVQQATLARIMPPV